MFCYQKNLLKMFALLIKTSLNKTEHVGKQHGADMQIRLTAPQWLFPQWILLNEEPQREHAPGLKSKNITLLLDWQSSICSLLETICQFSHRTPLWVNKRATNYVSRLQRGKGNVMQKWQYSRNIIPPRVGLFKLLFAEGSLCTSSYLQKSTTEWSATICSSA